MDNNILLGLLLGFGVPAIISIGVSLFAKFCPKEETFKKRIAPVVEGAAVAFYTLMSRWLKPAEIDKIEEGVFKTLAYWLDAGIHTFMAKLNELIFNGLSEKTK